jgi:hypothetical protein
MFSDLKTQFHNQILKKYFLYRDLRLDGVVGDQRLALAATDCANAVFHFREQMPEQHKLRREEISSQCPDFKLIADVSNIIKHKTLTSTPKDGPTLVNSISDIYELIVVVSFVDVVEGKYSHMEAVVCVDCTDGKRRCVDDALVSTINYWIDQLNNFDLGTFKKLDFIPFPGTQIIQKSKARNIRHIITQGLSFESKYQFMDFDYDLGLAKPKNLTGYKASFEIYQKRYNLDIKLRNDNIKGEYIHTIELNDEQSREYASVTTEPERKAFLERLVADHHLEIQKGLLAFIKDSE